MLEFAQMYQTYTTGSVLPVTNINNLTDKTASIIPALSAVVLSVEANLLQMK